MRGGDGKRGLQESSVEKRLQCDLVKNDEPKALRNKRANEEEAGVDGRQGHPAEGEEEEEEWS